jgi:hypothetical protein
MLHPQTRALLDLIEQRGLPPTRTLSVAELIDEANTAVAFCAAELRRALFRPAVS